MFFCRKIGPIFLWSLEEGVLSYHLIRAQRNIFRGVGGFFPSYFGQIRYPYSRTSDGWNSSKWTEHYEDWSKTLQLVKISEKKFVKYFHMDDFIVRTGYNSEFFHQTVVPIWFKKAPPVLSMCIYGAIFTTWGNKVDQSSPLLFCGFSIMQFRNCSPRVGMS